MCMDELYLDSERGYGMILEFSIHEGNGISLSPLLCILLYILDVYP